jgi:hypothetical protein
VESEWRMNVWRIGLQHTGIRLAARLVGASDGAYLTDESDFAGFHNVYQLSPFSGRYENVGRVFSFPGHPHFPYGWTVEPD